VFFLIALPSNGRHVSPTTKNTKIPLFWFFRKPLDKLARRCFDRPLLFFFFVYFFFYLHFWLLTTVRSVCRCTGKGYLLNKLKSGSSRHVEFNDFVCFSFRLLQPGAILTCAKPELELTTSRMISATDSSSCSCLKSSPARPCPSPTGER